MARIKSLAQTGEASAALSRNPGFCRMEPTKHLNQRPAAWTPQGAPAYVFAFYPFQGPMPPKSRHRAYRLIGIERSGMRITHSEGEHLVVLSDAEASALVEASVLLVVASQSMPGAALPPEIARVLGQLFDGLKACGATAAPADQGN